jgi:hypothetical protein
MSYTKENSRSIAEKAYRKVNKGGAVLVSISLIGLTIGSAANNTTAYEEAVATAGTPGSYAQATVLFKALGGEIAVVVSLPFIVFLVASALAGYWKDTKFWALLGLTFLTALGLVIALPSLWVAL